jgi:ADP-glucose pyrophosphorylase
VDDSASLAAGTQVDRSVIGKGVIVTHAIKISNSVIMPGVMVSATTDLDSVVMDGEHTVYCPGVAALAREQLQGSTFSRSVTADKPA